jgi:DNA-binding response OmpR family regulator
VIFVTARGAIKDYAIGREVGGDSYLVKPIARSALRSIVSLFAHAERTPSAASTAAAPESNATPNQDGTGVPLAPADLTASAMTAGVPPAVVPTKP